jgi:acyl-CoA hydrolase
MEVEVRVMSEKTLTGERMLTSHAYLTFVAIDADGRRVEVPDLVLETDAERQRAEQARARRDARLAAKKSLAATEG